MAQIGFALITIMVVIYIIFGPPVTEWDRIGDATFGSEVGQEIKDNINDMVKESRNTGLNDIKKGGDEIQAQRLDWMKRSRMYEEILVLERFVAIEVADDWQTWSYHKDFAEVAACYIYWEYPNLRSDVVSFACYDDWGQYDTRRSEERNMGYLHAR